MTPTAVELPWAIIGAPGMSVLDREHETTPAEFGFGSPRGGATTMTEVWLRAALWLGLALAATLISIRLRIATALSEIVVGTVAQLLIGALVGTALLGTTESWVTFLSATGAVFLTFLAGAELDPAVLRAKWRETGWQPGQIVRRFSRRTIRCHTPSRSPSGRGDACDAYASRLPGGSDSEVGRSARGRSHRRWS